MIVFGDNVEVLATLEMEALNLAGRQGQVYGETTPSSTGVEVIGGLKPDNALGVFFEDLDETLWFQRGLLTLVDHGAGMVTWIEGSPVEHVRSETGDWIVRPRNVPAAPKPWWKFWA